MERFTPSTFGELNADDYDELHDPGTTDEAVALISDLVGGGSVLELAIGTGRIALPLAARGHAVSGIDGSSDMVAKLREKPGGGDIPVAIGDFADVDIDGSFDWVILVFNTLFNLQSQDEQVRCFRNVAERLNGGGSFLVEAFVPDFSSFSDHQRMKVRDMDRENLWFEATTHDPVRQIVETQRVGLSNEGTRVIPLRLRYAWPTELDLMAEIAGLTLAERWGGWNREPFTAHSSMHVSIYRK